MKTVDEVRAEYNEHIRNLEDMSGLRRRGDVPMVNKYLTLSEASDKLKEIAEKLKDLREAFEDDSDAGASIGT